MSDHNRIKITDKVYVTSEPKSYLVFLGGEVLAFSTDESSAMAIAESVAVSEIRKLENPAVRVFRQEKKNGKEIQIYTQALGYLAHGSPKRAVSVEVVPVPQAFIQS